MQYQQSVPRKVAILSSYVPRQCGIATFGYDLRTAIASEFPQSEVRVIAVSDGHADYEYPEEVDFVIEQENVDSYHQAATFLNEGGFDVLCVQHEYGIFGGSAGSYLLELLRRVSIPVITTLHTVLREPNRDQERVMSEIANISDKVIVMSRRGADILRRDNALPQEKIEQIHHGVPCPVDGKRRKVQDLFEDEPSHVILTFGLLSPDKGIEDVIKALPAILECRPGTVYLVVGATHPHVKAHQGESYRQSLEGLAREMGVDKNVVFLNRFVSLSELTEFLALADIYVTPYLKPEQISSGTLAYAVGCGKACVSTPYSYAEELLAEGRGVLVPFRNSSAITEAITDLLGNHQKRHAIEQRALDLGAEMRWPAVANRYVEVIADGLSRHRYLATAVRPWLRPPKMNYRVPIQNLAHLTRMTDDVGILQHATYDVPNYSEGYCLDDNARALILVSGFRKDSTSSERIDLLLSKYLSFTYHALNPENGRFRNFMSFQRTWLETQGSDDSHGRAIWALGTVIQNRGGSGSDSLSGKLLRTSLEATLAFEHPRSIAFALLGLAEWHRAEPYENVAAYCRLLADRLFERLRPRLNSNWPWFEEYLSYCNARIPQALLVAGQQLGRRDMVEGALNALEWLGDVQESPHGYFEPVGSSRTYRRGETKPRFDQQPVEACASVCACLDAWRITGDRVWRDRAQFAFDWFRGRNHLGTPVYDPTNGGCRDGLHETSVNQNEGAESTISWMMALAEMARAGLIKNYAAEPLAYLS